MTRTPPGTPGRSPVSGAPRTDRVRRLRWLRRFYRDLGLKAFALFLAVLFWFHIHTEKTYEVIRAVPIRYEMPADSLVVVSDLPRSLEIRLRAKGKALMILAFRRPVYTVDLRRLRPGRRTVKINPESLKFPEFIEYQLLDLSPKEVQVILDRRRTRRVPVHVQLQGAPAEDYVVWAVDVHPESVTVSGPAKLMGRFKAVSTEPIEIGGRTKPLKKRVKLLSPSPRFTVEPRTVEVQVQIEPLKVVTLSGIPIVLHVRRGYQGTAIPGSLQVVLKGPRPIVDTLKPTDVRADLWITKFRSGKYKFAVHPRYPRLLELQAQDPETVLVTIRRKR